MKQMLKNICTSRYWVVSLKIPPLLADQFSDLHLKFGKGDACLVNKQNRMILTGPAKQYGFFEMLSKLFRISVMAVMLLAFFGCGNKNADTSAIDISANLHSDVITVTRAQFETTGMKLGSLEQKNFTSHIKANGYIDVPPEHKASVSVKLGGFVKSLSILPGGKVAKGAVLFTLENPDFIQLQQDYLETKAQLAYLQSDYERQKSLADENITSQKNFLKAESEYKVAKARVAGLQEKLKLLNVNLAALDAGSIEPVAKIFAPLSGYIAKVNITRGVYVSPADVAVEIVSTEHMHVELQVFEKDIHMLNKGQKLVFTVEGSAAAQRSGEVYLIGKIIEHDTRTVNIHGHIDEEGNLQNILPGMFVEAAIAVESSARTALPTEAVVAVGETHYVLVKEGEDDGGYKFRKMKAIVGTANNEWTEILNAADFKKDDVFLIHGAFNLIVE